MIQLIFFPYARPSIFSRCWQFFIFFQYWTTDIIFRHLQPHIIFRPTNCCAEPPLLDRRFRFFSYIDDLLAFQRLTNLYLFSANRISEIWIVSLPLRLNDLVQNILCCLDGESQLMFILGITPVESFYSSLDLDIDGNEVFHVAFKNTSQLQLIAHYGYEWYTGRSW